MKRLTIKVSGKVQGVFYRATANEFATQLGLTGIVRNEPDGSVYLDSSRINFQRWKQERDGDMPKYSIFYAP